MSTSAPLSRNASHPDPSKRSLSSPDRGPQAPSGNLSAVMGWVVVLGDALILIAATLLLSALFFEGLRLRIGDVRLTATSPWRLVVVLAVVTAARHFLVRRPSILDRLLEWARLVRGSESLRAAWPVFSSTRGGIIATGYLAVAIMGYEPTKLPGGLKESDYPPLKLPWKISDNDFLNLPARWDSGWYKGVAEEGYRWDPGERGEQNIAFFPAYPMMMRVGGALIGARTPTPSAGGAVPSLEFSRLVEARGIRIMWVGVGISLLAFLGALAYLYRLAREMLDEESARGALLLLAAYPFAYFFGTVYTESLVLLATLGAFYHCRRSEYMATAIWGLLAGFTHPKGCFLSVPLALIVLRQTVFAEGWIAGLRARPQDWLRRCSVGMVAAAMPGIAMLIFTAALYDMTGRWFVWMQAHQAWGRTYQSIGEMLAERYDLISAEGFYKYSRGLPLDLINGAACLTMLALAWPVGRLLGLEYAVFMLINLLPALALGGFLSMGRITSVLFPAFIYLGWRVPANARVGLAVAFAALQGLLAAMFYTWRPVF